MPPITANDVIQITMKGQVAGRPCENVIDIKADRPIVIGNAQSIAQTIMEAWQDRLVIYLPTTYAFLGCRFIDLDSETGDSGELAYNAAKPHTGTVGSPQAPNTSYLVRKVVSGAPRRSSFKMFLGPVSEAFVDGGGLVDGTELGTLNTQLELFRSDCEIIGDIDPVTHLAGVHYPRTKVIEAGSTKWVISGVGVAYDVTALQCQGKVASQRRRLRG